MHSNKSVLGKRNATTALRSSRRVIPESTPQNRISTTRLQHFSEVRDKENVVFCANAQDVYLACDDAEAKGIVGCVVEGGGDHGLVVDLLATTSSLYNEIGDLQSSRAAAEEKFQELAKKVHKQGKTIEQQGKTIEQQGKLIDKMEKYIDQQEARREETKIKLRTIASMLMDVIND